MPKIALIMLLIEIVSNISLNIESIGHNLLQLNMPYDNIFTNLFLISSLFSLLIGTVLGLSQTKIKRLFAYSTVSHVGFMLLCLGINTEESLESLLFYLIQYSITNFNAFLIILSFGYIINKIRSVNNLNSEAGDISLIRELKGQFYNNPLLTLSLAVCLFSMAGIPPLIGFFAKQQVLYSSIQNGYYFISIIAIIVSVISASYYLKIIKVMHFDVQAQVKGNVQDVNSITSTSEAGENMITNSHAFLISVLTLSLLLFMLKPSIPILVAILLALNLLLAVHRPDTEKLSPYECGFTPIYGQTRSQFSIHFYIVAILFLVFDLEILLLYPIAVTLYQVSTYGFTIAILFFTILTIGFVFELGKGVLKFTEHKSQII
jgi:NADH-ubiquinone oxidoreductase chain 2